MILEGAARGSGAELARHLLNPRDNDHVTVHAVEGFLTEDLAEAFAEAEAIAEGTQCRKHLFSLSFNPPPGETVSVEVFEAAIADAEAKLGLAGQPRAIVFHEKNGRRHAHCVWSRIDAATMRAIKLSHYKRKLGDVSRALYRRHDWDMPEGFRDPAKRSPDNYSREEAGQAKREERDPKGLKATFRRCWEASDSRDAFAAALKAEGYLLARGDRRGFVAVDADGKIWSLSRWCGVKPRELRARLGDEERLPSVEDALSRTIELPPPKKEPIDPLVEQRRRKLVERQREERVDLLKAQEARRLDDLRAARPSALRVAFLRMTGRYDRFVAAREKAADAARARDRAERQAVVDRHLAERRAFDRELRRSGLSAAFARQSASDAGHSYVAPREDLPLSQAQLGQDPSLILDHISKTEARFDRTDVLRALARRIDDPFMLRDAADRAMKSAKLVRLDDGPSPRFTTRDYQTAEAALRAATSEMSRRGGFGLAREHIAAATAQQDAEMRRAFGGRLSDEQRAAVSHILSDRRLACVVGLAGAGKSTMLATAMDAWRRQGVTVHGAALAGKAAEGLETASSIQSRTLASLETSWENGYEPIAEGDVLVVDEAGMIGTRQLERIARKMKEIGAKLVLVGDPDQLQPIEAGTPFRDVVERCGAARLTEIHRQREDWQKRASRDLAEGRVAEAVEAYEAQGAVRAGEDAFEALVESYAMGVIADSQADDGASISRLAFAHRRKDVHELNQAIRAAIRSGEAPTVETLVETETGPRAFAEGDRIVFGRNDRALGVKNGVLGTVERADARRMVVRLDGEGGETRRVTFDPQVYRDVDHGYAVTIHKSQGATVDEAYVLASRSMDRHLAYVAMTRHRDRMRLFLRPDDRPNWAPTIGRDARRRDAPRRSGPTMG